MGLKISECDYPCTDTNKDFLYPDFHGDKSKISIVMISEAPPVWKIPAWSCTRSNGPADDIGITP